MPYIFGELIKADLENLASNPSVSSAGRIFWDTALTKAKIDDGTNVRALLRNDQYCVFGNNGTANSNIRLQRGAAAVLQFVLGGDSTAEGSLATSLAQISAKMENYATGSLPSAANAGRIAFDTTTTSPKFDTGAAWINLSPLTTRGDLFYRAASDNSRLAIGSANTILKTDGTDPAWAQIVDAYVSSSAAITRSKLASGTNYRILANSSLGVMSENAALTAAHVIFADANGQLSGEANLAISRGGTNAATANAGFNNLSPLTTKGDIIGFSTVAARLGVGSDGQVLSAASGQTTGLQWIARHPLTTTGDIIYSSSGTTDSRLAIGSANQVLQVISGIPSWQTVNLNGKNYLAANPDAEVGTSGWATYADTAKNIPADATGGSPVSTWTRTTSSPLRGTGSFLWTKAGGANRQGEGVSFDFTLDSADQGRVIAVTCDLKIASGTFTAADGITAPLNDNTTTTNAGNSDLEFFLYDITNAVLIPISPQIITSNSTTSIQFKGVFQTAINSTSYRLVIHTATTTTNNYTVQFDNFFVGPQSVSYGSATTDWTSWTPTGSWSANTTYTGFWRRVGDTMELQVKILTAGAPTSANLTVNMPTGYTIDTTKLADSTIPSSNPQDINLGLVTIIDVGVQTYEGFVGYNSSSSVGVYVQNSSSTYGVKSGIVTATVPFTFGSTDTINLRYSVPIAGWSSTVLMSNETDTRVVAATYYASSATFSPGSNTQINYDTKVTDTHSAVTTGAGAWKFTAPVSGNYSVFISDQYSSGTAATVRLYKNGSQYANFHVSNTTVGYGNGQITLPLVAGDFIDVRVDSTITLVGGGTPYITFISINRLSGPSAIAATESVNASYTGAPPTGTLAGSINIIKYGTKEFDSHSAYSTSTGVYTAPTSGKYRVSAGYGLTCASTAAGNGNAIYLYVNSSQKREIIYNDYANVTGVTTLNLSSIISLNAGDTVDVRSYTTKTTPVYSSQAVDNYFQIERIGN